MSNLTELGKAMEALSSAMDSSVAKVARAMEALGSALTPTPGYQAEAKTLARDMAAEEYDIVGRNDVLVERDGGAGVCYYDDGTGPEEFTRYDLEEVRP